VKYRHSEDELKKAVAESLSYRQVLLKLNIVAAGGNYQCLKKRIQQLAIDTSHFKGKGWSKNAVIGPQRPISDYLTNKASILSYKLKKRLLREGYFDYKCYKCLNTEWNQQPIPLELEHINGNHLDNTLDNLTLLCPNCHAQTSTYRGKNISKT